MENGSGCFFNSLTALFGNFDGSVLPNNILYAYCKEWSGRGRAQRLQASGIWGAGILPAPLPPDGVVPGGGQDARAPITNTRCPDCLHTEPSLYYDVYV